MNANTSQPAVPPNALVCPSLMNMEAKGFDRHCLLHIQSMAFRAAAQALQHRNAAGQPATTADLKALTNQYLAGPHYNGNSDAVTPAHIARYMHNKSLSDKAAPAQLMREAEAIANIELPPTNQDADTRTLLTGWLAQHLLAMENYAEQCEQSTPIFARTLREQVARIQAVYPDYSGLRVALQVLRNGAGNDDTLGDDQQNGESQH